MCFEVFRSEFFNTSSYKQTSEHSISAPRVFVPTVESGALNRKLGTFANLCTVYRMRMGAFASLTEARDACTRIRARCHDCLVMQ